MRAVVQRCNWCRVDSEGKEVSSIGKGLSVLLGVKREIRKRMRAILPTKSSISVYLKTKRGN